MGETTEWILFWTVMVLIAIFVINSSGPNGPGSNNKDEKPVKYKLCYRHFGQG